MMKKTKATKTEREVQRAAATVWMRSDEPTTQNIIDRLPGWAEIDALRVFCIALNAVQMSNREQKATHESRRREDADRQPSDELKRLQRLQLTETDTDVYVARLNRINTLAATQDL